MGTVDSECGRIPCELVHHPPRETKTYKSDGHTDTRLGQLRCTHDARRTPHSRAAGTEARRRLPALVRRGRRPPAPAPGLCRHAPAPGHPDPGGQGLPALHPHPGQQADLGHPRRARPQDHSQPAGAGPAVRAPGGQRAGARPAAGAARRPAPGQAGLSVELRRGAAQHHPRAVRQSRTRPRHRTAPRHLPGRNGRTGGARGAAKPPVGHVPLHDWRRHVAAADGPGALDHVPRGARTGERRAV